ncbi:MAG: hypothetical protein ABSF36_08320 [Candidatus Methanomethylicaceae archaeon]|jgi:hypothetical protein
MFYTEKVDTDLRFGDVVRGFFAVTPNINEPFVNGANKNYNIDVVFPVYSVIIDPCCQIGSKQISLTPLIEIWRSFFDNPYLVEDLTRINKQMKAQQATPPNDWNNYPEEKKATELREGLRYAFISLFVYEKHSPLPEYTIDMKGCKKTTGYYMIDFRNIHKVSCDKIRKPSDAIETKVLELSIVTRNQLRDKIASYYGTRIKEDLTAED